MLKEISRWLDPQGRAFWRVRVTVLAWITILAAALILLSSREKARHVLFVVDWCNAALREAGRPVFGLLGNHWLTTAGGTLMQLLIPSFFYFYFLRRARPKSADVCLFWFGADFLGLGPPIGAPAAFFGCLVMAFSIYSLYIHWNQPAGPPAK
jgi:hypothetical protein